jgi:tetrahydromethanopterin S-methyltransferase subunit G
MAATEQQAESLVGRDIAIAVGVIVAIFVTTGGMGVIFEANAEKQLRWAGALLQIFGLGSVAKGIDNLRHQFTGNPKVFSLEATKRFLRRIAGRKPQDVLLRGVAAVGYSGAATITASGSGTHSSVEGRIAELEQRLEATEARFLQRLGAEIKQREESINKERNERLDGEAKTHDLVKTLAVGGIRLELIGLTWLVAGIFLSSFSEELARLF